MKKIFFTYIISVISCCMVFSRHENSKHSEKIELPFFEEIIQEYFYFHCVFPDNIQNIILFVEKSLAEKAPVFSSSQLIIEEKTLPELKKYRASLQIKKEQEYVYLFLSDKLINKYPIDYIFYDPCNIELFVGEEYWEYLNFLRPFLKGKYFDEYGVAIVEPENIITEFVQLQEEIEKICSPSNDYDSFIYQERQIPIYLPVEFRKNKGLFLFCKDQPLTTSKNYYNEYEIFLQQFCEKNSLSRIIFLLRDYR